MRASPPSFRQLLQALRDNTGNRSRLFFDGGLGTMLQRRGLPAGVSPELFCLERPEVLLGIHKDYVLAGADVISTGTFGGNAFKLPEELEAVSFNRRMAALARQAADEAGRVKNRKVYVAGSVGPCGLFLAPLGEVSFSAMLQAFEAQIRGLAQGGADLILIETQIDLAETRAAVIAARNVSALPVAVTMTFEEGVTLTGSSPEICAATLANLGVDIIGTNCSLGPEQMRAIALRLLEASPVPVLIQPNAGLPELVDGATVFPLEAAPFAELCIPFAEYGAHFIGGCCGTTPEHIAALRRKTEHYPVKMRYKSRAGYISLTSRFKLVNLGQGYDFAIIGERINPTGKKLLSRELVEGKTGLALRFAREQIEAGASVLDVNVGAPMVDEVGTLAALVKELSGRYLLPLSLDSSNIEAIKAALEFCAASPLVNSISGEPGRMEVLGPLCRDFGAPFILLPLQGKTLPVSAEERISVLKGLLEQMDALHIPRTLALVDALVLSVSSNATAAAECLKFIRYCAEVLKMPTVAGLSNISFGLPARELVNSAFLNMAAGAGLSAVIANPGNQRIAEAHAASRLLLGQDKDAAAFISGYSGWSAASGSSGAAGGANPQTAPVPRSSLNPPESGALSGEDDLKNAVVQGIRDEILPLLEKVLDSGRDPFSIVNAGLIPGITEVGVRYERKEYFLPQLLRSAETMQKAFARLKPLLEQDSRQVARQKIVTATVEGDIHDIGKNIVNLMLGNHGFEVIDLGKDVGAEKIVQAAVEHKAALIGLSALMTTTMIRMQDTLNLLKERNLHSIKVMIGGAVVTEAFAGRIGAHGFAADAVEAVKVAKKLLAGEA
ncbi:MAG: homocysteine S-methyltransferase family protein [Deltaproteobacteria bacterium]|nr:homocysteine S-methyltransferase family protein [Deltaproteobacteria bacterium]